MHKFKAGDRVIVHRWVEGTPYVFIPIMKQYIGTVQVIAECVEHTSRPCYKLRDSGNIGWYEECFSRGSVRVARRYKAIK